MKRIGKPVYGGIFSIASGVLGLLAIINYWVGLIDARGFGKGDMPPFIPSIIFGLPVPAIIIALLAIAGGIVAMTGRKWTWALAGAVAAVLSFMVFGVPAIALIVMSKNEFRK